MRDLTRREATRWVAQELPKQATREDAIKRIKEERLWRPLDTGEFPECTWAEDELERQMMAKFGITKEELSG